MPGTQKETGSKSKKEGQATAQHSNEEVETRMKIRKWSTAMVVLILTLSIALAACSSKQNTAAESGNTGGQPTGSTNPPAASDKNQTISISLTSQAKYPPNSLPNQYVKDIEEKFNVKLDYEVIPTSGLEKYNVMFASGSYPDFIPNMNSPTNVAKWASAGYLLPVGDYIDKLPTYRSLFSDEDWALLLDFASVNGKLYTLPSVAANDPMTWIYRKDAWDKAGITEFPKTMDELYEALKTLKAAYPDSVGIGVRGGINDLINGFQQAFRNPFNTTTKGFWLDPDAGNQLSWTFASEKHRDMLKFIAKLYKEKLVEQEFATITKEQWVAKRLTGKVLIDFQWASHTVDPEYELKDIPGGVFDYAHYLPSAYADKPALEFKPLNFSLFGPILSNKLAKEPEKLQRIFDYIEWGSTPEGQLFHQMGKEGLTYEVASGEIKYKEGMDRKSVAQEYGYDWWLKQSDDFLKSDVKYMKKQEAMQELSEMFNMNPLSAPLTEEEQQTINTTVSAMRDVADQFSTKAIMGIVDINDDGQWAKYLGDLDKVGMKDAYAIYGKYLK